MIGYRFTVTNPWNGESIVINDTTTDPANYVTIDESPLNEVAVRTSERDIAGRHGIKSYFSFYSGRNLSFQGKIVAASGSGMETLEQKLRKVFALPSLPDSTSDGFLLIQWTDNAGATWQIYAKVSGAFIVRDYLGLKRVKDYLIQLRSESPFIVSQTLYSSTMQRYWEQGGLKLPTKLPAKINKVSYNEATIAVGGNYDSPPVFTITGPAINPKITQVATGKFIQVEVTLADTDELVMDVDKGTIVLNGIDDRSQYLTTDSEYFYLSPGNNVLRFEHEGDTPNNTGVTPTENVVVERRNNLI